MDWVETTTGGAVLRNAVERYDGTYCAELERTNTTGTVNVYQLHTGLQPGETYRLVVHAKATADLAGGIGVVIKNFTAARYLNWEGAWQTAWTRVIWENADTTWRRFELIFQVDPTFSSDDLVNLVLHHHALDDAETSVFYDNVSISPIP